LALGTQLTSEVAGGVLPDAVEVSRLHDRVDRVDGTRLIPKEVLMTSTIVHQHRPVLPVINLVLAGSAALLAVVALTTDDVGSQAAAPPAPTVAGPTTIPGYAVLIVDEECGLRVRGNLAC
jgi:hypothetical protein